MLTFVLAGIACLQLALPFGEALRCYHCYDSFRNLTLAQGSLPDHDQGSTFIRCDKNKIKWNTWNCPVSYPICIIMTGTVQDHQEIVRTCAERNFCANYVPPSGVKLGSCRECNTDLCNDYPVAPEPPVGPDPLFVFNVNINLNINNCSSPRALPPQ